MYKYKYTIDRYFARSEYIYHKHVKHAEWKQLADLDK